jgi:hypothetical protein
MENNESESGEECDFKMSAALKRLQGRIAPAATIPLANIPPERAQPSNENKMSDGGRGRASNGVKVWKSSQNVDTERSVVRSIAWLDGRGGFTVRVEQDRSGKDRASAAWQTMNQNREQNATSK